MKKLSSALLVLCLLGCQGGVDSARDGADSEIDPPTDTEIGGEEIPGDETGGDETGDETGDDGYEDTTDWTGGELSEQWERALAEREVDYGAALRIASLRLRGDLPTLVEIRALESSRDPAAAYERFVAAFLADSRFQIQIRNYYRDTFKMGRSALDSAPLFAAQLTVEGRSMTELFTATSGTCPTHDGEVIVPGDCDNGVAVHAGLLTNPDVMRHFMSNLAFRRVRWVQETFACSAFPAEHADPMDIGGAAPYTAPWAFESIAGAETGGRIDFRDTASVICANCHATMNHVAPLFGNFDEAGQYSDGVAVSLPSDGSPLVVLGDWLPEGETTAWRFGVPAADLPALGRAMAADPDVHRCSVARAWNWALGKGDIVLTRAAVPETVIAPFIDDYVASGHRMDQLLFAIFTSDDFVQF